MTYPPEGFQPLQASDAELDLYGFPPRPSDSDALTDWDSTYSDFGGFYVTVPCSQSDTSNAVDAPSDPHTSATPWWSGLIDDGGVGGGHFMQATANIPVPQYISCPPDPSSASHWVGLTNDGYTPEGVEYHLAQNGIGAIQGTLSGVDVWWEQIHGSDDTMEQNVGQDLSPGDIIKVTARHVIPQKMRYTWVQSYVPPGHQHRSWASVTVHGDDSYSPLESVFINERNVYEGQHLVLRNFQTEEFSSVYTSWDGPNPGSGKANVIPHRWDFMTRDGTKSTPRLTQNASPSPGNIKTTWLHCQ